MKISVIFKVVGKSIIACALYLLLSYIIGVFVETTADATLWRQGTKDGMGICIAIATVISGIFITSEEMDAQ